VLLFLMRQLAVLLDDLAYGVAEAGCFLALDKASQVGEILLAYRQVNPRHTHTHTIAVQATKGVC